MHFDDYERALAEGRDHVIGDALWFHRDVLGHAGANCQCPLAAFLKDQGEYD